MGKISICVRCGVEIASFVQSVQTDPDSATWVKGGYCSRKCHKSDMEEGIDRKKKKTTKVKKKSTKPKEKPKTSSKEPEMSNKEPEMSNKVTKPGISEPEVINEQSTIYKRAIAKKTKSKPDKKELSDHPKNKVASEKSKVKQSYDYSLTMAENKASTTTFAIMSSLSRISGKAAPRVQHNIHKSVNNGALKYHPKAYSALIIAFIGLFFLGIIMGVAAIILSIHVRNRIRLESKIYKGETLAKIAAGLGLFDIILSIIY